MEARLTAVQEYVKSQWMGTEYIDGPNEFHGDFGNFRVIGCTLVDLGERGGPDGTPEYWDWTWKDLNRVFKVGAKPEFINGQMLYVE